MRSRDFRSAALKRISSGNIHAIERLIYSVYASISHKLILDNMLHKEKLDAKIISIGNITFGGTGKTPLVNYLSCYFAEKNVKVGVALPGYKGKARDEGMLVSNGDKSKMNLEDIGDEAAALNGDFFQHGIPAFVDRNRINAARELIKLFNCQLVIMDDAFHFTSVQKDADICLVSALNPFGGGPLFKRGALREPPKAIKRADAIIVTHRALAGDKKYIELEKIIRDLGFNKEIFSSDYLPVRIEHKTGAFINIKDAPKLKVIPVSGIGNPEAFEMSLRAIGVSFGEPIRFNDHHLFTSRDVDIIKFALKEDNAEGIIMTPKDWVRFEKLAETFNYPVYILHSEICLDEECLVWLDRKLNL